MKNESSKQAQMQALRKTIVSGSCNAGFLKVAVDELLTYRIPKNIIDYIETEKLKVIIGNPPYDVSNCH